MYYKIFYYILQHYKNDMVSYLQHKKKTLFILSSRHCGRENLL